MVASPLSQLFAEERHADRQAREALFCTFNADLGFFERTILGVTQATGARTTIIADARMSNPDPRAARNAGIRYVSGVAATHNGSAFHPKLLVVVGPERVVVAVGSGNLSVGGWHLNAETWTVATGNRARCVALATEISLWLRSLDQVCAITPQAVDGLRRTAAALDALVTGGEVVQTGHRFVHNLQQPIIEQLPAGPVEELLLYAPFHDTNASAVRALVERLAPGRVTIAIQSGRRTVIQPRALEHIFDELAVPLNVVEDSGKAYRHGKVVEARTVTGRWTLTGSPNLSAAALLWTAADRGNVELGVVAEPSVSLFPKGTRIALGDVPAVSITSSAVIRSAPKVVLIEAIRTIDGLRVTFTRALDAPVPILASRGTDYDIWAEVGAAPAAMATHVFKGVYLPGGSRVRVSWNANGSVEEGQLVFVTDPDQALARIGEDRTRRNAIHGPTELLGDPRLIERWMDGIRQLAAASRAVTLPRVGGAPTGDAESKASGDKQRIDSDADDWLTYADDARARLGGKMFRFALGGLPAAARGFDDADQALLSPTDRLLEEHTAGLQDDDPNTVNDEIDPGNVEDIRRVSAERAPHWIAGPRQDDPQELSEHDRRRIRRQLWRAAHEAPNLPAVDRLAIGGLVLVAIQWKVWDAAAGAGGWIKALASVLAVLDLGDIPPNIEPNVASFAAVAIYMTRDHLDTSRGIRDAGDYKSAAGRIAHLLPAADLDLIGDHGAGLRNSRGFPIDTDEVMRIISMIVQNDPFDDAIDALRVQHSDWKTHRHQGPVLHIHGSFRNAFSAAAETSDKVDSLDEVAVWATSTHGNWALVVRSNRELFCIEPTTGPVMWRHLRLNPLATASRIARDRELASRLRVPHGPLRNAIPEAMATFVRIGLDIAHMPPDCF